MAKKEKEPEQQTMEEYLLQQLQEPVVLKDGSVARDQNGNVMTKQQAIATNILNLAMKGDIKAAQYLQSIQLRADLNRKK